MIIQGIGIFFIISCLISRTHSDHIHKSSTCIGVRHMESCSTLAGCQWDMNLHNCISSNSSATVAFRFAKIFQDHMVLQSNKPVSVWGYATSLTSKIKVSLQCDNHTISTVETVSRQVPSGIVWRISLPPQKPTPSSACNVMALEVQTANNVTISDILFGDVWVCSGQSNMAFSLGTPLADPTAEATLGINASADIASSVNYPLIRLTTIGDLKSATPLPDFGLGQGNIVQPWVRAQPSSVGNKADVMGNGHFSAVCYLFGRGVFTALGGKIPIGLISASWGGSSLEDWLDKETLQADSGGGSCPGPIQGGGCGASPTQQYNGMISPIQNVTIKGVIWYQGESNCGKGRGTGTIYTCRFSKMMNQWRAQWYQGTNGATDRNFPFGVVQIGPMTGKNPSDNESFIIRQGQTASYGYMPNPMWPNTFLAPAFDLPNPPGTHCIAGCIHIFNKQEVARRLVLAAERYVYGNKSATGTGPRIAKTTFVPGSAQKQVVLTFTEVGKGLLNRIGTNATLGIEVLLKNTSKWIPAIPQSYTLNEIILNPVKDMITAVRYAWSDTPCPAKKCAIYNSFGIPSTPFVRNCTK